jgi:hypothetical protein
MSCLDVAVGAGPPNVTFSPGTNDVLFTAKKREYAVGLSLFRTSPWARRWFKLVWAGDGDTAVLCVMHKLGGEVKQRYPLHNAVVRVPSGVAAAVPHMVEVRRGGWCRCVVL